MPDTTSHITPAAVAELLGVSRRTLSRWHALRVGPARCKIGRTVLYRRDALEAWLEANETQPVTTFTGDAA
ncbi:helix-turn-helix domain-containing protein [Sulfitobacter sp. KE29]|uniref:helix-turn-helix transcriptional regulator n=1 Tax=unclassified Sulfitobacter TaxID=196795 RepID=UPI0023E32734|nr:MULTISPECIES: helix-turn-helix domain-containing protein [unclassified Sulfitobacter]MDF3419968.1 helix-turn-helix domain-containing protein [Sulfitobacter sp. Ks38]MDF3427451.1 helix-turn-helix domain-containing protein [Sulfitobacter sp. KE29]MDF3431032.1 helix-turn-helix domain-containing protein [Sulfitobacter sp. S46]MDF3445804.1 helix-turn-helix domain-containing protein [Sulfitobacter sp. KE31]MDF3549583.1 helix-turn-helix domain-containing protein [Sulfitobacter sp. KE28]